MIKKTRKLFLNYLPLFAKSAILYKIPSLFHYLEIKPRSAIIMLTQRCNLKCVMCKQWKETARKEFSTADWKRTIGDLKKNGINNIHFTGGEPLLRQDLGELVQYSSHKGLEVGITSNGFLLQEELLADFIKAGLNSIAISVDALQAKYEALRGRPNSFVRVRNALSLISAARKKSRLKAYINFVLMKDTIEEFEKVKGLADKLNLPIAVCLLDKHSAIFNLQENKDAFWITAQRDFQKLDALLNFLRKEKISRPSSLILNFPAIDFIGAYFKDPLQRNLPCLSSQARLFIGADGRVWGGCLAMPGRANLKDTPLKELLQQERYKSLKKSMFYKRCPGCSCGYLFNIQHFSPLVIKDALMRMRYFINENKNGQGKVSSNHSH